MIHKMKNVVTDFFSYALVLLAIDIPVYLMTALGYSLFGWLGATAGATAALFLGMMAENGPAPVTSSVPQFMLVGCLLNVFLPTAIPVSTSAKGLGLTWETWDHDFWLRLFFFQPLTALMSVVIVVMVMIDKIKSLLNKRK